MSVCHHTPLHGRPLILTTPKPASPGCVACADSDNWFTEWYPCATKSVKVVCFLTADYIKSPYCMKEFGIGQAKNKLLVVACEPLETITAVDPEEFPHASNALAFIEGGGQVIFHGTEVRLAGWLSRRCSTCWVMNRCACVDVPAALRSIDLFVADKPLLVAQPFFAGCACRDCEGGREPAGAFAEPGVRVRID